MYDALFFFSSRRRHTRCALVTGVQTCALPIFCLRKRGRIEAAGQAIDFRERVAVGRHRLGPLGLHLDNIVGSILDVGEQEAAARIAFAYLGERFDRLRVDIVHDALGARARRVGIGAERRESAETLEPARLRLGGREWTSTCSVRWSSRK